LIAVGPPSTAAITWSEVGPAEAVLAGERTPDSSGESELTWKSSLRPPAGTLPPFSVAVGIFRPEMTLISPFTGARLSIPSLRV
jgi:hypothetical protein